MKYGAIRKVKKIIKGRILAHARAFDWRANNCMHAVAEVVDYYHNTDCLRDFGFEFADTERETFKRLRKKGYNSLEQLLDNYLTRKDKLYARTGDICLIGSAAGIYRYDKAIGFGEDGLTHVNRRDIDAVYDLTSYKAK